MPPNNEALAAQKRVQQKLDQRKAKVRAKVQHINHKGSQFYCVKIFNRLQEYLGSIPPHIEDEFIAALPEGCTGAQFQSAMSLYKLGTKNPAP